MNVVNDRNGKVTPIIKSEDGFGLFGDCTASIDTDGTRLPQVGDTIPGGFLPNGWLSNPPAGWVVVPGVYSLRYTG